MKESTFVILAEGCFDVEGAKTASSAIRYLPERVAAVLDAQHAGCAVEDVLGFGGDIPVVGRLEEALALSPRPAALLVGVATRGGTLPDGWHPILEAAIDAGLDVWSGLHNFLEDDPALRARAARRGVRLRDLRRPPSDLTVATGRAGSTRAFRVLTVGTDCNVGKMTASLELRDRLRELGVKVAFAATGQTGILVAGGGIAVDAVVSDFVAGAAERVTLDAVRGADVVLVEGQGSLLHPGYSGVTLGLLHGSMPQAMILCDRPSRECIYGGEYDWVKIPPLDEVVAVYEEAARWIRPPVAGRVIGLCRSTYDLPEAEARRLVAEAGSLTGLPVTDPIRFGVEVLAVAVRDAADRWRRESAASEAD
ncbi:MAG: DUF1611 domain-containing protein [Gemmatimonadota bacterium]